MDSKQHIQRAVVIKVAALRNRVGSEFEEVDQTLVQSEDSYKKVRDPFFHLLYELIEEIRKELKNAA